MLDSEGEKDKRIIVERFYKIKITNELQWSGNLCDNWTFCKQ